MSDPIEVNPPTSPARDNQVRNRYQPPMIVELGSAPEGEGGTCCAPLGSQDMECCDSGGMFQQPV